MTEPLYKLRFRAPSTGAMLTETVHWRSLTYEKRVNHPGALELMVAADDDVLQYFITDYVAEVWRKYPAGSWYRDFIGLHRAKERTTHAGGLRTSMSQQVGLLDLLARRVVLGYAGTAYTQKSGVAETVLKAFVDEQCVSGAIYRGITGLTIEADGAGGNAVAPEVAWRPLLEVLQEFAEGVGGGDFNIVMSASGAITLEFRWHDGQLGLDRTFGNGVNPPVVFSADMGNAANVTYRRSRLGEITSVVVGGQGDGAGRATTVRDNAAAIAVSPWNRIETFLNESNISDASALNDAGDAALEAGQFIETLECDVLQGGHTWYGRDFSLGDLVTIRDGATEANKKITAVTVTVDSGGENVKLEMADISYAV